MQCFEYTAVLFHYSTLSKYFPLCLYIARQFVFLSGLDTALVKPDCMHCVVALCFRFYLYG